MLVREDLWRMIFTLIWTPATRDIPVQGSLLSNHRSAWSLDQEPTRKTLQWCHNGLDSILNHQPHDCLLKGLFRHRSKKTSKLCVTGLCAGNSPGTSEFPAQMASNAENVSIWWRYHELCFVQFWNSYEFCYEILSYALCVWEGM